MCHDHNTSTEETKEATDRKIPNLYPDLYNCGLENVEDVQKEKTYNGYPDLKPYFEEYDTVFNSEVSSSKSNSAQNNNNENTANTSNNNSKMNNYSKRLNNELQKMNSKSQTRTKPKAALKEKKCNEMVAKSVQKEERKAKRKQHKHIRRGYKFLAFTVGLPITIPYLIIRTKPNKEDDDIKSELDRLTGSTAKLLGLKDKSRTKKNLRV